MILTTYRRRGISGFGQALSLFANTAWLPHKYPAIPADAADLLQNLSPAWSLSRLTLGEMVLIAILYLRIHDWDYCTGVN